jgi:peptide/nickel transport system substrate-binding protein
MQRLIPVFLAVALTLTSCAGRPDRNTIVLLIENSPNNLDPRIGTDAQSERIGMLLFDSLVKRDEHFNLTPNVAASWETPDPLTYIFHLHSGIHFHNGALLTARDVKWTLDSMLSGAIRSTKTSSYSAIARVDAPDENTIIIHLKENDPALLWNLSDGAFGIVPYGSGADFGSHPIGSGPFRFVSQQQDKEVMIERNPDYWQPQLRPKIERVCFAVVPDAITRALELRKGSADIEVTALPADMVNSLRSDQRLAFEQVAGTTYNYLAFNLRDPILRDVRVRQAIAYAINREPIIHYLYRDEVRPAESILPPASWAYHAPSVHYDYDPERAKALLDAAGYRTSADGIRFHLTMKTSTDEAPRLVAAVLQEQLHKVGIALDIRTMEFATFYSDVQKGAFQLYSLRWIGAEDPEMFEAVFASWSMPPNRWNRGHYSSPEVDSLIRRAKSETDQQKRAEVYAELQEIIARDLPYLSLWYFNNVMVHTRRVADLPLAPNGNYDFLMSARIVR